MNFGKLNKRLTLKTVTLTQDGIGGYTEREVTQKTTWGSLEPLSAREQLLYGMEAGSRSYRIRLRYDSNYEIDQLYWVEWTDRADNTRTFRIVSVIDKDERAHEIILLANERTESNVNDTMNNDAILDETGEYYLITESGEYYIQQEA